MRTLLLSLLIATALQSFDLNLVANKIYQNECSSNPKYLVHWNKGESFPSLGIGHFIWYPKGVKERFEESFPLLIEYMQKRGVKVASWLKKDAPWSSAKEMKNSKKTKELREFLLQTMNLQASFMADRLGAFLPNNPHIKENFQRVARSKNGYYILIDYLNFKGSGQNPKERYKHKGWGLIQVLSCMQGRDNAKLEFIRCAKKILKQRVENSPQDIGEKRWLKGWFHRVDSYKF